MEGFKKAYTSIFNYYISNMHWIYFIPNESFMNILHGHKLMRLPYLHEK